MIFTKGHAKVTIYTVRDRKVSNPDHVIYTLAWYLGPKNRHKKTITDKAAAIAFAKAKLKVLASTNAGPTVKVPELEWDDFQRQIRRLKGTPLHAAVDYYLDHHHKPRVNHLRFQRDGHKSRELTKTT